MTYLASNKPVTLPELLREPPPIFLDTNLGLNRV